MIARKKSVLFISGSVGLGHITRDLAVAKELRRLDSQVEIFWMASHPAILLLEEAGEKILPESRHLSNDNFPAEAAANGFQLNLLKYLSLAKEGWENNIKLFEEIFSRNQYDLIIGDETYEIVIALTRDNGFHRTPFAMIYDFIGLDSVTKNPMEKFLVYLKNRKWALNSRNSHQSDFTRLFVGELEDIPDKRFGFLLPNRREWAKDRFHFLGYILPFDPTDFSDAAEIRAKLGYGRETLILCSIGGTAAGKELLELCGQAFPILKEKIRSLRMILVCGPRFRSESLHVPPGIEVRGYVPNLYEHFAACDLAIVQGGGTTTMELAALRRPFLYFPLEGHFEQQVHVAGRMKRFGSGVRMEYSRTTPERLADMALSVLGQEARSAPFPIDGAAKAAHILRGLF